MARQGGRGGHALRFQMGGEAGSRPRQTMPCAVANASPVPRWLIALAAGATLAMGNEPGAGKAPAPTPATLPRQEISVGTDRIVNLGPWTRDTRRDNRPPDLWQHAMHGVIDHFATPFRLEDLMDSAALAERWLDRDQPIRTPYKESDQAAIRCRRSETLELPLPIPIDMPAARGRTVRIFFWMKGEDAGARNNTWHCPDVDVIARDAAGNVLYDSECHLKSQRTFPWRCFHTDRFVPKEAAGLYLRVYNRFTGTAWFSTPSWELLDASGAYSLDDRQDPATGSLSKNPLHEALAYHLECGFGMRYPWRFVLGAGIGLQGHTHDITTKEGLQRYYFEKARKHPDEMNHAVLYLQSMYRTGTAKGLLPAMEEGWLEHFAAILINDQDDETGYWHDGQSLSLGLTFHLCDMHFRYYRLPRADREDLVYPGQDLGLRRVPRADRIIRTTLMMQSSWVDDQGETRKAAWSRAAYRHTTEPDAAADKCYMGTTWDAIYLLRLASRYVDDDLRQQVYEAVKAAFRYVLERMVYPDGTFRQCDTDAHPTKRAYMEELLGDVSWLERRVMADIPAPEVLVQREGETHRVTWQTPAPIHNSLRVYVAPGGTDPAGLNESMLAGVIHRTGHRIVEMDPLLAVQVIRRGIVARWGGTLDLPPPEDWRGRRYLPWKLRQIAYPLPHRDDLGTLSITIPDGAAKDLYVTAATWYGEESPPVRVAP